MSKEDFGFWFWVIGISVVMFAMLVLATWHVEKKSCLSKYADFQPEYHSMITGCLVQHNGKTVPAESLRVMN